jgi:hypothetical protein
MAVVFLTHLPWTEAASAYLCSFFIWCLDGGLAFPGRSRRRGRDVSFRGLGTCERLIISQVWISHLVSARNGNLGDEAH